MYTPNNIYVFQAAYFGAIAGMGGGSGLASGLGSDLESVYADPLDVALAYAIAFDLAWNTAPATQLDVDEIGSCSEEAMATRQPGVTALTINPLTWAEVSLVVKALVQKATATVVAEGIVPTAIPSGAGGSNSTLTPPSNGSWSVDAWWIDPLHGSDTNSGTSALAPLKTYRRLVELWGTISPVIGQATTITFLSSHVDNSDPFVCTPYYQLGGYIQLTAPLVVVKTGILGGVVVKNRATGQLLEADLGAGVSANQLVDIVIGGVHTRSWTFALAAGTVWKFSQVIDLYTIDSGLPEPTSNDGAANGQAFTIYELLQVNVCVFQPTILEYDALYSNVGYVTNIEIQDFSGLGGDCHINGYMALVDALSQRNLIPSTEELAFQSLQLVNVNAQGLIQNGSAVSNTDIYAGIVAFGLDLAGFLGNDVLIASTNVDFRTSTIQSAYIDAGTLVRGDSADFIHESGVGPFLWGDGTYQASIGETFYPTGVGAAVACFLNAGGLKIGGGNTSAYSATVAQPSVINASVPLTPAALDAAAGAAGFGGVAFEPGGASIVNTGV